MSVQARLEAAMRDEPEELDADGEDTVDVEISSGGITREEVEEHDAVRDVEPSDGSDMFTVYVSASSEILFGVY